MFDSQVEVETICGTFRLDFVTFGQNTFRVAFECDGKDFHNEARDEWRDAMILGSGEVDIIYRFRGSDLMYHMEDIIYAVAQWEPELFSQRGMININLLALEEVKYFLEGADPYKENFLIQYKQASPDAGLPYYIRIKRLYQHIPEGYFPFHRDCYEFATSVGGNLDEVIAKSRAKFADT